MVKNIKLKTKRLITEVTLCNENCLNVRLRGLRAGAGWDMGALLMSLCPKIHKPAAHRPHVVHRNALFHRNGVFRTTDFLSTF